MPQTNVKFYYTKNYLRFSFKNVDVYGLTGGIGSGKSAVGALLEEFGIPVLYADNFARKVVAPGTEGLTAIVEAFGVEILNDMGDLDCERMASIVFTDASKRA